MASACEKCNYFPVPRCRCEEVQLKEQIKNQSVVIRKLVDALRIEKKQVPEDIDPNYEAMVADLTPESTK